MFAELPDELAILCVDGSLSCAVKLGSTNKLLKQKLQRADIPLRVLAPNILTAVLAETTTGFKGVVGKFRIILLTLGFRPSIRPSFRTSTISSAFRTSVLRALRHSIW